LPNLSGFAWQSSSGQVKQSSHHLQPLPVNNPHLEVSIGALGFSGRFGFLLAIIPTPLS